MKIAQVTLGTDDGTFDEHHTSTIWWDVSSPLF